MSSSLQTPAVDLYYTRCGAATASALALRQHWLQDEFAQAGTVLLSLRDSPSLAVRNAHYHHRQAGLFREGGNIPPIWARGEGQDTVVLGITWLDEYQGILSRRDAGIHTVADLRGKRLGVPRHREAVIDFQRGAAQHGFETALGLAGLRTLDAAWVDIDAPSWNTQDGERSSTPPEHRAVELEALDAGEVDAVFLRFTRGLRSAQDPRYQQVLNINTLPHPLQRVNNGTPRPITVDRAFLDRHPDVVVRYLKVLLRTAQWAAEHPAQVLQLLARDHGGSATPEEVMASHGPQVHRAFEPLLSDTHIAGLEAQKEFLRRWGYVKQNFSVARDWVVHEPLAEARRELTQAPYQQPASARSARAVSVG
ncbi:MAG: ABC transporter substrate-binding protein [Pseudomonadota bacterium]